MVCEVQPVKNVFRHRLHDGVHRFNFRFICMEEIVC